MYNDFRNVLPNEKNYNDFKSSFGDVRHSPEYYKSKGQMVHYILLFRVSNDKKIA